MVVVGTTTPIHKTTSFAAKTTTPSNFRSQSNPKRPPLLPSEKDNSNCHNNGGILGLQRRPKSREVHSRYLSTSSSSSTSNSSSSTAFSNSSFFSSSPSAPRCASPVPTIPVASSVLATPVTKNSAAVNRTQSVERKRPATPKSRMPVGTSAAAKLLVSSSRSLSVSFQGESYAIPRVNSSPSPLPLSTPSLRKGTPERKPSAAMSIPRKGVRTNDQPWPGRVVSVSRSVDLGCERRKLSNCGSGKVVRALQDSLASDRNSNRVSCSGSTLQRSTDAESLSSESNSESVDCTSNSSDVVGGGKVGGRSVVVSSRCGQGTYSVLEVGSEAGSPLARSNSLKVAVTVPPKLIASGKLVTECPGASPRGALNNRGFSPPRREIVRPASPNKSARSATLSNLARPATPSKLTRPASPSDPVRPATTPSKMVRPATPSRIVRPATPSNIARAATPSNIARPATPSRVVRPASPSRVIRPATPGRVVRPASPSRVVKPASPSKLISDQSSVSSRIGRMASPSRARNAVGGAQSVPFHGTEVRRVKVADNRLGDAHLLRILHNRHLQWRFVNARAEAMLSIQQLNAERSLYSAWRTTTCLLEAVSSKRKELQWLRQKLKLLFILKGQILHLEEWALMDKDHSSSLSSAIESLKASTVRLPLVAGARVDIQDLKEAVCSAADVMHSMAASICSLLQKVEEVRSLVAEVSNLTAKEHSFLNECKDTLSVLAAMQVKDCSLRAHMLQLKSAPSRLAVEV